MFRAIFTAMVYDNGIKRPLVRAPNSAGVQRLITRYSNIQEKYSRVRKEKNFIKCYRTFNNLHIFLI